MFRTKRSRGSEGRNLSVENQVLIQFSNAAENFQHFNFCKKVTTSKSCLIDFLVYWFYLKTDQKKEGGMSMKSIPVYCEQLNDWRNEKALILKSRNFVELMNMNTNYGWQKPGLKKNQPNGFYCFFFGYIGFFILKVVETY